MTDTVWDRGQKMSACARGYTPPNMQVIPIRTEEGRKIKEVLRKEHPLPDMDFADVEARILSWGAQK